MHLPDDGQDTFAHGLAPLTVSQDANLGSYWEPNVWIIHVVAGAQSATVGP